MDWIHADEPLFEYASRITAESDTALYGRVTYDMMESYWPSAGDQPDASEHDKIHARWYNQVPKVVLSNTQKQSENPNVRFIGGDVATPIQALKQEPGKTIVIFGSPSAAHSLMQHNLIDEYWLFVNPVLIGKGIPVFKNITDNVALKLVESNVLESGVVALHYVVNS
ncbi:dihydrofolate reductase family protein [Spirosoma flavus]